MDQNIAFEGGPVFFGDYDLPLPEARPFSPARLLSTTPTEQAIHSPSRRAEDEVFSSFEAPQRQVRAPKVLQADYPQELANADLAQWNTNYLANMAEATKIKQQHKTVALAKKNAAYWVLSHGIAGVGISSGDDRVPNPLAIFSGQALLAALTGREALPAGTKRTRSLSDGLNEDGESRRVRARGEDEQQVGRGDTGGNDAEGILIGDDDGMMFPGEEMVRTVPFLVAIC